MKIYEAVVFLLNTIVLLLVVTFLWDNLLLSLLFLFIVLSILFTRIDMKKRFEFQRRKKEIDNAIISDKIDAMEKTVRKTRESIERDNFLRRVDSYDGTIEEKVNELKKNVSLFFGSLEERIRKLEEN